MNNKIKLLKIIFLFLINYCDFINAVKCFASPTIYSENLEGVEFDYNVGLQDVECKKVTNDSDYHDCLSYDFILNIHKLKYPESIPIRITQSNFCTVMKNVFLCGGCCICSIDNCNKKNQCTNRARPFNIKSNYQPTNNPLIKYKTTTTTKLTSTTKIKTTKKTTLSTKKTEKTTKGCIII
ncbi:hypothetical protein Mgra_00003752 [Meloidogyne graminicola]|uniref:Uncharacterized protein n=1 Tax=Meloidogyne graminicola TaxID=189291 RepID=A0A8S9ZU54_9BILA|nr:hypothetical protein Mgra_00003752 [Meloidogyne graminicola]